MSQPRQALLDVLLGASRHWQENGLESLNVQLRQAFLDYVSDTPDNLATAEQLYVGQAPRPELDAAVQGLMLERLGVPVSDVLWLAFGESDIPDSVAAAYPSLTRDEWNQVMRIAQIVLSLFDAEKPTART